MRTVTSRGPVLQRIARTLLRSPVSRLWPCARSGFDAVPEEGPAVLCPNHLSFFDSVLMMLSLDRPVYFIGKADYLDSWKTRRLFPALGMIPIDRDSGARAMLALDAAADVLRHGALLCVYPEGTRSRDGHLHRGYTGAARVATAVGCPILPVGIIGTLGIQPPGARLPRPRRACSVSIGQPLVTTGDLNNHRNSARAVTNELMERIAALSGQRYVTEYSQRTPRPAVPAKQPTNRHRPRFTAPWEPRPVTAHVVST
jgi:1-acyl-sn-glycerol-3-phosphate acyltransferase